MIMNIKQKKIKIELRIKLNYKIYNTIFINTSQRGFSVAIKIIMRLLTVKFKKNTMGYNKTVSMIRRWMGC